MTTNINIKFTVPSPIELKKAIRDHKKVLNLKRRLDINDNTKWLEKKQQRCAINKEKHEAGLAELLNTIEDLKKHSIKIQRKLDNAKQWMTNVDRNIEKDDACLAFQQKAVELIEAIKNIHIPKIEATIKARNYTGAIQWNEKYIRNKPAQVIQRINNDCNEVIKRVEANLVDFYSIKCKEKHLLILKARLTKTSKIDPELLKYNVLDITLEQRIANIESALAFRKLVDSRANGQILGKLAQEYFANEQLEINAICEEEWLSYLDRVYFKGGMEAFYI